MTTSAAGRSERAPAEAMIDWDLAARTAARLALPGPRLSPGQAADVVAELRRSASRAQPFVATTARLEAPGQAGTLVVDRAGWATVNVGALRDLLDPVLERVTAARPAMTASPAAVRWGRKATGAEIGALLAVLSSRVLGQYDPFGAEGGRLTLVAPNVVRAEQELEVDPGDFRLWVCLHEETHRVQFTAVPWLADHLRAEARGLIGDLMIDPRQLAQRLGEVVRALPDLVREQGSGAPLLEAVQTPDQRARLARITAVMSLLEGHADVVMDEVGPAVVPSVEQIRRRFEQRRKGRGTADRVLRRLLGLDAKLRQYADGARFVRGVQAEVGVDGFNAVWTSPDTLPEPAEIADPRAWVRRVHG